MWDFRNKPAGQENGKAGREQMMRKNSRTGKRLRLTPLIWEAIPYYFNFRKETNLMIREITQNDFDQLMKLYMQLHDNPFPEKSEQVMAVWNGILADENHHIIVAEEDGSIVSSCVCVVIPNLTRGQRPYAFIENVITDEKYRKKGLATACLNFAREIAQRENCYKMMLLTGSKQDSTLRFYEQAGYNKNDKTAFIQWL